ncbi:hypothetical protein [Nocardioides marmotae]|uniref:hypothetical protein n=1 Tax=Nocardioides marmotae TaxID=2663857 RepID=UPI0012B5A18D|nr:hypothetical protein [Nocardioides marmotae]MBC9733856.1 hypothetical protein [Nocardioides marmotae]MTB84959.1 hypothetical protein [Nocardioides marmotae]
MPEKTRVYFNLDRDRRPELVLTSDFEVYKTKTWNKWTSKNLAAKDCEDVFGTQGEIFFAVDPTCLGLDAKKVAVSVVNDFVADNYFGSKADWAPGKRKWTKRLALE